MAWPTPDVARAAATIVAAVWLIHGLYLKLLGGSPRQLAIVQAVPGLSGVAGERALLGIGVLEIALGLWVLSGAAPRPCAAVQTLALLSMNVVEVAFARHLLLWPAALIPLNLMFLSLAWIAATGAPAPSLRTRLKRHPLAVEAHFDECLTLTYAVPAETLQPLLPPGLQLETLRGQGFVAVAVVQTAALRPAGWPRALGQDFFLAGYRVFVRFRTPRGHSARGLRILRSDTNRWRMVVGGNLLTHYNYHHVASSLGRSESQTRVRVVSRDGAGDLDLTADASPTEPRSRGEGCRSDTADLPAGSPFTSLREARYFAGPLPFTFDYEEESHAIIAIEARRRNWKPSPIRVDVRRISFFDQPAFAGTTPILAGAFRVRDIDYCWKRGVYHPLGATHPEAHS